MAGPGGLFLWFRKPGFPYFLREGPAFYVTGRGCCPLSTAPRLHKRGLVAALWEMGLSWRYTKCLWAKAFKNYFLAKTNIQKRYRCGCVSQGRGWWNKCFPLSQPPFQCGIGEGINHGAVCFGVGNLSNRFQDKVLVMRENGKLLEEKWKQLGLSPAQRLALRNWTWPDFTLCLCKMRGWELAVFGWAYSASGAVLLTYIYFRFIEEEFQA